VEGAAPDAAGILRDERLHPLLHLAGGFVGKREQQDGFRLDAIIEQPRHAIRQRPRLARSRARNDERLPRRADDGGVLLLIELRLVVDAVGGFVRAVQRVFARHLWR
jgi:hypothetical protein